MGADWGKLALIHAMIGYEANVLGMLAFDEYGMGNTNTGGKGNSNYFEEVQAMLILGFLIYTAGGILMVLTKLGGLGTSIIFTILSVCAFIIAALFLFIGVGLHADDYSSSSGNAVNSYASTLTATSGCLGLLASVFLLLALCCKGKGSSTSPS